MIDSYIDCDFQDIIDFNKPSYILHQCSVSLVCSGKNAGGLAKFIFDRYPETNDYLVTDWNSICQKFNEPTLRLGNYSVTKNETLTIVNCYTQYYPGAPIRKGDRPWDRLKALEKCLDNIYTSVWNQVDPIFVPYLYGCGLAGGEKENYHKVFDKCKLPIIFVVKK